MVSQRKRNASCEKIHRRSFLWGLSPTFIQARWRQTIRGTCWWNLVGNFSLITWMHLRPFSELVHCKQEHMRWTIVSQMKKFGPKASRFTTIGPKMHSFPNNQWPTRHTLPSDWVFPNSGTRFIQMWCHVDGTCDPWKEGKITNHFFLRNLLSVAACWAFWPAGMAPYQRDSQKQVHFDDFKGTWTTYHELSWFVWCLNVLVFFQPPIWKMCWSYMIIVKFMWICTAGLWASPKKKYISQQSTKDTSHVTFLSSLVIKCEILTKILEECIWRQWDMWPSQKVDHRKFCDFCHHA